jgi:hypothetical protein
MIVGDDPAANTQSPTLQYVQQPSRICEPNLDVLMFQTFKEKLHVSPALLQRTLCPFFPRKIVLV